MQPADTNCRWPVPDTTVCQLPPLDTPKKSCYKQNWLLEGCRTALLHRTRQQPPLTKAHQTRLVGLIKRGLAHLVVGALGVAGASEAGTCDTRHLAGRPEGFDGAGAGGALRAEGCVIHRVDQICCCQLRQFCIDIQNIKISAAGPCTTAARMTHIMTGWAPP